MISPPRNGFLLFNKNPGVTSFGALAGVKKAFDTGKVGHTGTLDKFASGLLLLLVGRGVKLASLFENCVKEYTAKVFFGAETDTLDPEGVVVSRGEIPSREKVEAALAEFRGDILQAPPAYSAIHINGQRAHELARGGKAPEMKKRPVTVFELEITSWTPPEAEIRARVSAGTYIRSLARDIALAAGSRAHLSGLTRTKVGPFRLEDAAAECDKNAAADFAGDIADGSRREIPVNALRPLDKELFGALSLPVFTLDERAAAGFIHGKPLPAILGDAARRVPEGYTGPAGVFSENVPDELLGVIENRENKWIYRHVFGSN